MLRRSVIGVVLAVCCGLIVWSGLRNRAARVQAPTFSEAAATDDGAEPMAAADSPLTGRRAPEFTLRDLAGLRMTLSGMRGKVVLINFWATWCAPCRVEMPWFIDMQRRYAAQGFTVLGINKDYPEDLDKVPGFAREMRLNYPVLYGDGKTYAAYGCCDYLPMSYYIDRDGIVRSVTIGLGDRAEMDAKVRALLGRDAPSPPANTTVAAATGSARPR